MDSFSLTQKIGLLAPVILIELGLLIFALIDIVKRKKVRGGNKWLWVIIVLLIQIVGPILYLVLGREEE
jgi:hypothetical protein